MSHMRLRLVVILLAGLLTGFASWMIGETATDGFLFDIAARLRSEITGPQPSSRHVAVVALDAKSLDAPELAQMPRALMGPQWAELIEDLSAAQVRAIGFDILFQYSGSAFSPGWDRPFLAALNQHHARITLGRSEKSLPAAPFLFAIQATNDPAALGMTDLAADPDGIYRKIPLSLTDLDGKPHLSLVGALAARAGAKHATDTVRYLPTTPLERHIPAYSLIDILRCAKSPVGRDRLNTLFSGRVALAGGVLPEEDRKTGSDRFLKEPPGKAQTSATATSDPCALSLVPAIATASEAAIPGVFLHAAALDAILAGKGVTDAPRWMIAFFSFAAGVVGAMAGFLARPPVGAVVISALAAVFLVADAWLLSFFLWLPPGMAFNGALLALGAANATRILGEERRARKIQKAFAQYVSPLVVARLADEESLPVLGGETRDVTIMFADLSGFTALSGQVPPTVLMETTNRFLGFVVTEVEASGGYVDKFIGDAVMAVWGAPASDSDHALHAVTAAIAAAKRIDEARRLAESRKEPGFAIKIGINTGQAIVGNVGTANRFNYTAVGETVNLASRLESVPAVYGVSVVIGEETAARLAGRVVLVELDRIRVKGHDAPLAIFEPLAPIDSINMQMRDYHAAYGAALSAYRARDFAKAAQIWRNLHHPLGGNAPAVMAERAEHYANQPAAADWDGAFTIVKA